MAQYNLGKVSIRPRGAYSASTSYTPLDTVTNLGGAWLCIAAATGIQPGASSNWANYWMNITKGIRTVAITSPSTGKATITVTLSDGTQTSITIDTAAIGTGAVGTTELADGSVTNPKLAPNAVDTGNVANEAITFPKLAMGAKTLAWENITVPDSAWAESTDFQNYPWRAAIPLPGSGVDATYLPTVDFTEESKAAVDFGPDAVSYAGGVYIYAASAPEVLVKLNTLACEPTLVDTLASTVFASIAVAYAAGATCTCTDGTTTLTAKSTSGKWTFAVPSAGEWIISDGENEQTVNITTQGQSVSVKLVTYLYKNGNEYASLTGGWTSDYTIDTASFTKVNAIKEATSFTVKTPGSNDYSPMGTANKIDVTGCSSIKFNVTAFSGGSYFNIMLLTSTVIHSSVAENVRVQGITSAGEGSLDVSDLSGEYYLTFSLIGESGMTNKYANIDKVWLE